MPYMRNVLTSAVLGPMDADSAEYQYLRGLKQGSSPVNFALYEDVPFVDSGVSAASPATVGIQAMLDALAIAVDFTGVIGKAPFAGKVTAVQYFPVAAVTGANTNSRTLSCVNAGQAGAGNTNVASLALVSGTNLTAQAANTVTLNATPANLVVAAGDEIEFTSAHVGTGIADPGGLVVITFSRD